MSWTLNQVTLILVTEKQLELCFSSSLRVLESFEGLLRKVKKHCLNLEQKFRQKLQKFRLCYRVVGMLCFVRVSIETLLFLSYGLVSSDEEFFALKAKLTDSLFDSGLITQKDPVECFPAGTRCQAYYEDESKILLKQ